jgi:hypothetical protein
LAGSTASEKSYAPRLPNTSAGSGGKTDHVAPPSSDFSAASGAPFADAAMAA